MTMYDKIARMKPEQKNHWIDIPELSPWGERFFASFSVADAVAEGEERLLLEQAIDGLYDSFQKEHALTDSALQKAEFVLLPLSPKAKQYTLHCVAHAHIDMDWLWGIHETVQTVLSTFRTMLDLMEEYPAFTFSQSQCAVYRIAEFYDPALFRRIKERVQEGRWEFAGSSYVELDKNMPNAESMARHILYTKEYLCEHFGIAYDSVVGDFHPDSFGHGAWVPEILTAGGIQWFYHCRGLDGEYLYRWQAPSGAEVLALNEPLWYNDSIRPMYLNQVPQFCKKYGIRDMMKIYGVGNHGGGPTRQDLERILDMQTWPLAPKIKFSTYNECFSTIAPYKDHFPVVTGELGPTFTGCYTSQAKIKEANRMGEDRLYEAEALTAFAVEKTKMEDFNPQFRFAWERILFNQFHDILPGSNTEVSKDHAMGAFEEAMGTVMAASSAALRAFADKMDTSAYETPDTPLASRSEGAGMGLHIDGTSRFRLPNTERGRGKTRILHFFNPTGFGRKGVVEASLWDWPGNPEQLQVHTADGTLVSSQVLAQGTLDWSHNRTDLLIELSVPALGYTTVVVTEAQKQSFCFSALPPDPRVTYYHPLVLENDLVKITFREEDLSVASYIYKETGKELLGPQGAGFWTYRERTGEMVGNAWVEGVQMAPENLHKSGRVCLKKGPEKGALRQSLTYEIRLKNSRLEVTATLEKGSPILELAGKVLWMELADETGCPGLCFKSQLSWTPDWFLGDGLIGLDKRKSEQMHDHCARNFTFAPGEKQGMALLTDNKYGYRGNGDVLQVSLLRSSSGPDPYPELGERRFRLGLCASEGETMTLKAIGTAFTHRDLPYVSNTAHPGQLPLEHRFIEIRGAAQVASVKRAQNGKATVLRLLAPGLEEGEVQLRFDGLQKAFIVDIMEQPMQELAVKDEIVHIQLGAGKMVSLLLYTTES